MDDANVIYRTALSSTSRHLLRTKPLSLPTRTMLMALSSRLKSAAHALNSSDAEDSLVAVLLAVVVVWADRAPAEISRHAAEVDLPEAAEVLPRRRERDVHGLRIPLPFLLHLS
jgi:hypothetical protein